jgi:hypothetical protein
MQQLLVFPFLGGCVLPLSLSGCVSVESGCPDSPSVLAPEHLIDPVQRRTTPSYQEERGGRHYWNLLLSYRSSRRSLFTTITIG